MNSSEKKRVLVVDDVPANCALIQYSLEELGYNISCVGDGVQALEVLYNDSKFDVILLDRMMPVMDGLEVFEKLQAHEKLKEIPVIIQTAAATPQQIKEVINAGIFYYLTKPFSKEVLISIVEVAIRDANKKNELIREVSKFHSSFGSMDACVFRFQTLKEARNLSYLIANACPKPQDVILGIYELMINAIEHGNLGITYEEKKQLMQNGSWEEEIEQRLKHDSFSNLQATVHFEKKDDLIDITIKDEGKGFYWMDFMQISVARAIDPNGRGIAFAKHLEGFKLEYNDIGNIVHCSISL